MCYVAGCVLKNPLLYDRDQEVAGRLRLLNGKARDKELINFLQEIQPPKVSGKMCRRYYARLKQGIDLDAPRKKWKKTKRPNKQNLAKKKKGVSMDDMIGDVRLSVTTNTPRQSREEKLFLQSQTLEQFKEKRNWDECLKRQKEMPEPNFHCE